MKIFPVNSLNLKFFFSNFTIFFNILVDFINHINEYCVIVNKKIELFEKDFETAFKISIQMFPDVPENILVVPISLFKKNRKFKNFMHRFGELDESNQSLHSFYFKTALGTISSENNFLLDTGILFIFYWYKKIINFII